MTGPEALLIAITIIAPGGFWLGYVFLVNDAKWKIERDKARSGEGSVSQVEVAALRDEIQRLRSELMEHRDRSSEYDLSLEARLHQLETRMRRGSAVPGEELTARLGQPENGSD